MHVFQSDIFAHLPRRICMSLRVLVQATVCIGLFSATVAWGEIYA